MNYQQLSLYNFHNIKNLFILLTRFVWKRGRPILTDNADQEYNVYM